MPPQHQQTIHLTSSMMEEGQPLQHHSMPLYRNSKDNCSERCFWQDEQHKLEGLRDVLQVLKSQEALYRRSSSKSTTTSDDFPKYHDSWRPVMVSWMFSVVDTFALMPHVVATGMYYLDTCSPYLASKEHYPLMAMTALNLAIKCHETKMFPLDQLVQLMKGTGPSQQPRYTPEDVIRMERTLLRTCQWKLHPPTVYEFLHQFVQVIDEKFQFNVAQRCVMLVKHSLMWEHALHQQQQQQHSHHGQESSSSRGSFLPSTLAYASLLLAMEELRLPLPDKQACCLALLQVADMSTHTPHLSMAYNWLVYAKGMQEQMTTMPVTPSQRTSSQPSQPQQQQQSPVVQDSVAPRPTTNAAPAKPRVVSPPTIGGGNSNSSMSSSDMIASSTSNTTMMDASKCNTTGTNTHDPMVVEQNDVEHSKIKGEHSHTYTNTHPVASSVARKDGNGNDDEACGKVDDDYQFVDDDDENEEESIAEVIFYSHTYTGDGFEVMAVDFVEDNIIEEELEEYQEDSEMDDTNLKLDAKNGQSSLLSVLEQDNAKIKSNGIHHIPSLLPQQRKDDDPLMELVGDQTAPPELVLTESSDEDGFEVSYANLSVDKESASLSSMLASPRDVAF